VALGHRLKQKFEGGDKPLENGDMLPFKTASGTAGDIGSYL